MPLDPEQPRRLRGPVTVGLRVAASAAGAAFGLAAVLQFVDPPSAPLFLASLGGSAVFLFGLTRAPAAQPRALFGGHTGGALLGALRVTRRGHDVQREASIRSSTGRR